jgi:predicted GIY-YIG superfamily endonuclease
VLPDVDAPTVPGVYYLVGPQRKLLYVGKASNLRRRLADHARSARWKAVVDVRWELVRSDAAAVQREADVIVALRPPRNRSIRRDQFFGYVTVGPKGLELGRAAGEYGCFPHLGIGGISIPSNDCIDGFNALQRLVPRASTASVHALLSGDSDALDIEIDDEEQPHTALGIRKDMALASRFFVAGPKSISALRARHGGTGVVTKKQFVTWIRAEVDEVLR